MTKITRFGAGEDAGCANGGVRIEAGIDFNDNNQLDANERDSTSYVCDLGTTDRCSPNPCRNGGVCTNGPTSYSCACPRGFGGPTCEQPGYALRGAVSNLNGQGLTLATPGLPNLVVPAGARSFEFPHGLSTGTSYAVTVAAQPYNRAETCSVQNGTGVVGESDVSNIAITCAPTGCVSSPCPTPLQVIVVPWDGNDPTVPHPAYNGHETTFKAIARGGNGNYQVDWDYQGDFVYDQTFIRTNRFDLSARFQIPAQAATTTFQARVRVTSNGETAVATYPVRVLADVPLDPEVATEAQRQVMRDVAIDDGLWFLHKQMTRTGNENDPMTGAQLSGSFPGSTGSWNPSNPLSGMFVELLARSGHRVAFPNAYLGDMPSVLDNARRWRNDPYSEDMARLVNGLMNQATIVNVSNEDEDNRTGFWPETLKTPIPGTDDLIGIYVGSSPGELSVGFHANVLRGLAAANLTGYLAQTGDANRILGRRFEFIIQQMVDALVWAQNDFGVVGSWYYTPNAGVDWLGEFPAGATDSVEALWQAEHSLSSAGVIVPNRLKWRLAEYIRANANSCPLGGTGGSYSTSDNGVCDFSLTATHLFSLGWLGASSFVPADTRVAFPSYSSTTRGQLRSQFDSTLTFINSAFLVGSPGTYSWDMGFVEGGDFGRTDGRANLWGMVHWTRAARVVQPEIVMFGTNNRPRLFNRYLLNNQETDGGWRFQSSAALGNHHDEGVGPAVRAAWALMMLLP